MCYVDDMFAVFNSSADAQLILQVLNNQHPNLDITCEEASGHSLPLLDVEVMICDGEFDINVYSKLTLPMYFYILIS